jgi:peptide/nickel transport system permease protein
VSIIDGQTASPARAGRLLGLEFVLVRLSRASGASGRAKLFVGSTIVAVIALAAAAAPLIAPYGPNDQDLEAALGAPSWRHLFGTDQFGRDVLSRTIYAGRLDLQIAFIATVFCFLLGLFFGLAGGYFGRIADQLVGRLIDFVIAFPSIVFIIALIAFLGNNLTNLYVALTVTGWTAYARITRGEVLAVKNLPYILSARALGYSHRRILFRHVLPNVVTPAGLFWITDMVGTILLVTSLSYLGLGPQPPTPEWGAMIAEARPFLLQAWWIPLFPGLAIVFTGIGLALLGDGLADRLRPEAR